MEKYDVYFNNNLLSKSFSLFNDFSPVITKINYIEAKNNCFNRKHDLELIHQKQKGIQSYNIRHKTDNNTVKKDNCKQNKCDYTKMTKNNSLNVLNYSFHLRQKIGKIKEEQRNKILRTMKSQLFTNKHGTVTNKPKQLRKSYSCSSINKPMRIKKIQSYNSLISNPSINKISLKIAERLEPSMLRLTKKKKKRYLINSASSDSIKASKRKANISQDTKYFKTSQNNINYLNDLYLKGVSHYQNIQQKHDDNSNKQANEYQLYSFKPKLSTPYKLWNTKKRNKMKTLYKQQTDWQSFIQKKTSIRRGIDEIEESCICTFKPKIIAKRLLNDDEFIKKYLNQINNYVRNRRKKIQNKSVSNKDTKNTSRNTINCDWNKQERNSILQQKRKVSSDKIADQKPLIQLHYSNQLIKNKTKLKTMSSIDLIKHMRTSLNIKKFFEEEQ